MVRSGSLVIRATTIVVLLAALVIAGCTQVRVTQTPGRGVETTSPLTSVGGEGMATIYLAGGCFWGIEKYMASVPGVANVESGYANGETDSPSYGDVSTGQSGYAETVRVDYDPDVAPLPFLLGLYYEAIEPTSLNRQGNDIGSQYRTGIYYTDPADRPVIERSLAELQSRYDEPVVVESEPLANYTPAEEYHQDYLEKNPGGYCHIPPGLFDKASKAKPDPSQLPTSTDT